MTQEEINNDGVPTPGEGEGATPEADTPETEAPSVSPEEETVVAPEEEADSSAPSEEEHAA